MSSITNIKSWDDAFITDFAADPAPIAPANPIRGSFRILRASEVPIPKDEDFRIEPPIPEGTVGVEAPQVLTPSINSLGAFSNALEGWQFWASRRYAAHKESIEKEKDSYFASDVTQKAEAVSQLLWMLLCL